MAGESVLIQPTGGVWGQIGVDIAPGRPPENLTCSANEWGSDTASFQIHRDGSTPWSDLLPGAPVEIARHGIVGWSGRVEEVTADDGEGTQTVLAKGWQYHLDDDMLRPFYVHRNLTPWKDWRSNLAATLTTWTPRGQIEVGDGAITFATPDANAADNFVYFDAGPGCTVARVVIDWEEVVGVGCSLKLRYANSLAALDSSPVGNPVIWSGVGIYSGTYSHTLSTPCRYIGIQFNIGAGAMISHYWRIRRAVLFGQTSFEASNESSLTLDKVAKNVLASGALPLLSQDTDGIETFGFNIPELAPRERKTPRELLAIAQAFHDCRVQVDVNRKLIVAARASTPSFEVGAWGQHSFRDGSTSREPIASGVYVEGTGADGEQLESLVDSAKDTLPSRQGYNKRNSLPLESSVTSALMTQMASIYLGNHETSPFKGEQTVQGWGDVRDVLSGTPVHAFHLLTKTEEQMRFGDRIDPDTGGIARDGRIKAVTYSAETETAQVTIDNESRKFEAVAARMAAVVGS